LGYLLGEQGKQVSVQEGKKAAALTAAGRSVKDLEVPHSNTEHPSANDFQL